MHTIYPSAKTSIPTNVVRDLISRTVRIRFAGGITLTVLTVLFATVPSNYGPLQGSFLAVACATAMLATFPAVIEETPERMLGGIYQDRRDVALLILAVTLFSMAWLGVEVSTWN